MRSSDTGRNRSDADTGWSACRSAPPTRAVPATASRSRSSSPTAGAPSSSASSTLSPRWPVGRGVRCAGAGVDGEALKRPTCGNDQLVVGDRSGRQPVRVLLARPAGAVGGPDAQRGRTGRTRTPGRETSSSRPRSAPAWRHRRGRWTPSRSGCAGRRCRARGRTRRTRSRPIRTSWAGTRVRVLMAVPAADIPGELAHAPMRERQHELLLPHRAPETTNATSSSPMRRGRPPAQCGANAVRPRR